MPAMQAFTLLRLGEERIKNQEDQRALDITHACALPYVNTYDYYKNVIDSLNSRINPVEMPKNQKPVVHKPEQERNSMLGFFGAIHG